MNSLLDAVARAGPSTLGLLGNGTPRGEGLQDPASLERLHELILPPPVSGWPSTPGWLLLCAALLTCAAGLAWLVALRRRERAYRREALGELDRLVAAVASADSTTRIAALQALPALLKRTALAAWPRREVASLSGERWLAFLADGSGDARFRATAGRRLALLSYDREAARGLGRAEVSELFELARRWIVRHPARRGPQGR